MLEFKHIHSFNNGGIEGWGMEERERVCMWMIQYIDIIKKLWFLYKNRDAGNSNK